MNYENYKNGVYRTVNIVPNTSGEGFVPYFYNKFKASGEVDTDYQEQYYDEGIKQIRHHYYPTWTIAGLNAMLQELSQEDKIATLKKFFNSFIDIEPTDSYSGIMKKVLEYIRINSIPWGFDVQVEDGGTVNVIDTAYCHFTVDWGDGTTTDVEETTEEKTTSHTYAKGGIYHFRQFNCGEAVSDPIYCGYTVTKGKFVKIVQPTLMPQTYEVDNVAYTAISSVAINATDIKVAWNEGLYQKLAGLTEWQLGDASIPNTTGDKYALSTISAVFATDAKTVKVQLRGEFNVVESENAKYDALTQLTIYPDFEVFKQALTIFTNHTAKVEGSKLTVLKGSQQQKCYDYAVANYSEAFDTIEMQ